jgi:hypothetical protein
MGPARSWKQQPNTSHPFRLDIYLAFGVRIHSRYAIETATRWINSRASTDHGSDAEFPNTRVGLRQHACLVVCAGSSNRCPGAWPRSLKPRVRHATRFSIRAVPARAVGFEAQAILDVTSVRASEYAAFKVMAGQEHLWEYYGSVAMQRGMQGTRNSDRKLKHGESYQRVFPQVADVPR